MAKLPAHDVRGRCCGGGGVEMWGVMQVIFASLVGWGVGDGCSVRLVVRVDVPPPPTVVCAVPGGGGGTAAALSRTGRNYPYQ